MSGCGECLHNDAETCGGLAWGAWVTEYEEDRYLDPDAVPPPPEPDVCQCTCHGGSNAQ